MTTQEYNAFVKAKRKSYLIDTRNKIIVELREKEKELLNLKKSIQQ